MEKSVTMNDLLELDLKNKDAAAVASPYENVNDRREIYLKYLILSAFKKQNALVEMSDSLFYGRRFYALTRLFDFYVNNNVFDLIILKPDSDEMLFNVLHDDIHSNIYGYVVARISEDLKTAEIMGYFMSKDYSKIVYDKKVNLSKLRSINGFEDIEILDSQMTLADVSERFFELMSGFMDEDLDEQDLSELACLLYNSEELRAVFADLGRFDRVCLDVHNNPELLEDDFLSILGGSVDESFDDSTEDEYLLDDLNALSDNSPEEISAEDIDLGVDLESLSMNMASELENNEETIDSEVENESVNELNTLDLEEDSLQEEEELPELLESLESDDLESQNDLTFEEVEPSIVDEKEQISESTSIQFEKSDDEFLTQSELLDEDLLESLDSIDDLLEDGSLLNESESLIEQNIVDEPVIELPIEVQTDVENEANSDEEIQDDVQESGEQDSEMMLITFDEDEVENIDIVEDEEFSDSDLEGMEVHFSEENVVEETQQEGVSFAQPQQEEVTLSSVDTNEVVDDELLSLLGVEQTNEDNIDDSEVLAILGIEPSSQSTLNVESDSINQVTKNEVEQQVVGSSAMKEQDYTESEEKEQVFEVLYNEENTASSAGFPGEGLVGASTASKTKNSKNSLIALVAIVIVLAGGFVASKQLLNKGTSDFDMPNDISSMDKNDNFANVPMPPAAELPKSMPEPVVPVQVPSVPKVVEPPAAPPAETKIVSSLSKQAGAAPVILKSVAWQVPTSISNDAIFNKYLQIAGKNIKINLASDLLDTDDFAYNNKIKVSMTVKNNAPVKNVKVVESSGSKSVDELVLQSIKQTLKYINTPVMTSDVGDREVILVISI